MERVRSEGDNRIQRDDCRVAKQISTEGRERNADAGTKQSSVETAREGSVHFSERTIVVESSGEAADWMRTAEMSMDSGNGLDDQKSNRIRLGNEQNERSRIFYANLKRFGVQIPMKRPLKGSQCVLFVCDSFYYTSHGITVIDYYFF